MKKYIILLSAFALIAVCNAKDLTGKKIYINPGHGGYDSNDRNVPTIPFAAGDNNGFYESSCNLVALKIAARTTRISAK